MVNTSAESNTLKQEKKRKGGKKSKIKERSKKYTIEMVCYEVFLTIKHVQEACILLL